MSKDVGTYPTKLDKEERQLAISKKIIFFSALIIIISFCYLLFRRWFLILDATFGTYGSGFFIIRHDILIGFTIFFDSIQFLGILGLFIAFILYKRIAKEEYQRYIIIIIITLGLMVALTFSRTLIIHIGTAQGTLEISLIGFLPTIEFYTYSYAFFIHWTDTFRILITILLLTATIFFTNYLRSESNISVNVANKGPIVLSIFFAIYIITIMIGVSYHGDNSLIHTLLYYFHYGSQNLLQIGNIIVYSSYIKRSKLLIIS
ncbi:MAG TPA: hypothetical protein VMZ29_14000 [Candidatus Bathyarchaeia archaeon]|nr:hypothetical protein [Candidatus Bathyarchaeia archaeon]